MKFTTLPRQAALVFYIGKTDTQPFSTFGANRISGAEVRSLPPHPSALPGSEPTPTRANN
jgi:hypothetical protein